MEEDVDLVDKSSTDPLSFLGLDAFPSSDSKIVFGLTDFRLEAAIEEDEDARDSERVADFILSTSANCSITDPDITAECGLCFVGGSCFVRAFTSEIFLEAANAIKGD